jgi:hypothetical protein
MFLQLYLALMKFEAFTNSFADGDGVLLKLELIFAQSEL